MFAHLDKVTLRTWKISKTHGMLYFVHEEGLRLDFLRATDQRFLGGQRVTLGDSIELFAIVTSPSRLRDLKNLTSCSKLSTAWGLTFAATVRCLLAGPGHVPLVVKPLQNETHCPDAFLLSG